MDLDLKTAEVVGRTTIEITPAPPVEFGTDGIRGEALTEITTNLAERFGRATAEVLQAGIVVVGRDTRESGAELSEAAMRGADRAGAIVIDAGILPTPGIAYLASRFSEEINPSSAGIILSASHNPPNDNGLKLVGHDGGKPSDTHAKEIESHINGGMQYADPDVREGDGIVRGYADRLRGIYEDFLASTVEPDLFRGLKVVVDAANGAAFAVAPNVVARLGGDVVAIAGESDGQNINVACGATHPDYAAEAVKTTGADFGIVLDGDADRVMLISKSGKVIDGDRIMLINALAAKKRDELAKEQGKPANNLPNNTVVGTVMSNMGTEVAFNELGITFERADVGDTNVARMMQEKGTAIGGEQSGHIILDEYAKTGDGMLAALQTMQALRELNMTLDEAADLVQDYPQACVKTPVEDERKQAVMDEPKMQAEIKGLEAMFEAWKVTGRVLVRPSGTEKAIRVMVELEPGHEQLAAQAAEYLVGVIDGLK